MGRGPEYAHCDLTKFEEEDSNQSVSDVEWVEMMKCNYQSVEYGELVALSGVISMCVKKS